MKEDNNVILMDKEGFKRHLEKIDVLKQKISKIRSEKHNTLSYSKSDGFHPAAMQEIEALENLALNELKEMTNELHKISIIEKDLDTSLIDINDFVTVSINDGTETSNLTLKLVGGEGEFFDDEIMSVSLNSPLGKAIYHKKVNELVTYNVDGSLINVLIIDKYDSIKENKVITRKNTIDI